MNRSSNVTEPVAKLGRSQSFFGFHPKLRVMARFVYCKAGSPVILLRCPSMVVKVTYPRYCVIRFYGIQFRNPMAP